MGKTDWKAEAKALKKKVKTLKSRLTGTAATDTVAAKPAKAAKPV